MNEITKDYILSLKKENPAKFLEVLPHYITGSIVSRFVSHLKICGVKSPNSTNIVKAQRTKIAEIMSSPIDIKNVLTGSIIYIIGSSIWTLVNRK